MRVLSTKNFYNLGVYQVIEIYTIFCNVYIVFKDKNRIMFYFNNYSDSYLFN